MPKEYIPKDAANKWICETCDGCEGTFCAPCDVNPLKSIPAADVVEVVRCRECQHWDRYDNTAGCGYCHNIKFEYGEHGYVFHPVREPDFYCADGKRKDGGQGE